MYQIEVVSNSNVSSDELIWNAPNFSSLLWILDYLEGDEEIESFSVSTNSGRGSVYLSREYSGMFNEYKLYKYSKLTNP